MFAPSTRGTRKAGCCRPPPFTCNTAHADPLTTRTCAERPPSAVKCHLHGADVSRRGRGKHGPKVGVGGQVAHLRSGGGICGVAEISCVNVPHTTSIVSGRPPHPRCACAGLYTALPASWRPQAASHDLPPAHSPAAQLRSAAAVQHTRARGLRARTVVGTPVMGQAQRSVAAAVPRYAPRSKGCSPRLLRKCAGRAMGPPPTGSRVITGAWGMGESERGESEWGVGHRIKSGAWRDLHVGHLRRQELCRRPDPPAAREWAGRNATQLFPSPAHLHQRDRWRVT